MCGNDIIFKMKESRLSKLLLVEDSSESDPLT